MTKYITSSLILISPAMTTAFQNLSIILGPQKNKFFCFQFKEIDLCLLLSMRKCSLNSMLIGASLLSMMIAITKTTHTQNNKNKQLSHTS